MQALIFLIILVPLSIYEGFIAKTLWAWFITPFGLPAIGIAHALGIALFVSIFKTVQYNKDEKPTDAAIKLGLNLFAMTYALVVGAIVHSFM